jgi:hypothetical protein
MDVPDLTLCQLDKSTLNVFPIEAIQLLGGVLPVARLHGCVIHLVKGGN